MQISSRLTTQPSDSIDLIFDAILKVRNITSSERDTYLHPPTPTLPMLINALSLDPQQLDGVKLLVEKHLKIGSDILIYGDYDADGITATAILYKTLTHLAINSDARILPFIPDRTRHGYGISQRSIDDIQDGQAFVNTKYSDFSPSLIITVDTGIVANSEVQTLRDQNIDVVITDHHQSGKALPNANYIIHSIVSSGSTVAWILALSLTNSDQSVFELIDLATIGIVADQIKLTNINRTIVTHGLQKLKETNNLGIRQLMKVAKRDLDKLSTYDINYALAPRINATGRLTNATTALRLLCSRVPATIKTLAHEIDKINQERQDLTQIGIDQALKVKPTHKIIITSSPDYHKGVVGLIAGRLAEKWHRPALAISLEDDIAKGSARSIGEINITNLLRKFESDFLGLGGHKLAAGFSVQSDKLETLTKKLYEYADKNISDSALIPTYLVETTLTLKQTSIKLAKLLTQLAPFGRGNPQPKFTSHNLIVIEDKKLGNGGIHHRLTLEQDGVTREAIWFNCASNLPAGRQVQSVKELVYTLNINLWQGKESLQLVVKHADI